MKLNICRWIAFGALCSCAFGSVNDPIRWEWGTGYRNDCFHWHLKDGLQLKYSEHARDVQFWENSLTFRTIYRDIALFARGTLGSFGRGDLNQKWENLNFTSDIVNFSWNPKSWNTDGWGYFGYSVNLTEDRVYQVILIPMVGYGVNYEHNECNGSRTASGSALALGSSYQMISSFPSSERMCWFGPLFGGLFVIHPGGRLKFETGYAYHRLHLRFKAKNLYNLTINGTDSEQETRVKVKDRANIGHSGWGHIDYTISKEWRMGIEGQIQYFTSRILDAVIKDENTVARTSQKFKIRWTAFSGIVSISRTF